MAGTSHHCRELHRSSTKQAALAGSVRHEACRVQNTDTGTKSCLVTGPAQLAHHQKSSPVIWNNDRSGEGIITWDVSKPAQETKKP